MATVLQTSTPPLTVIDTPTVGHMKIWWSALQHDPARGCYTDFMPHEIEDFLVPVQRGLTHVHMFLVGDEVGGVYYVHDWGADAEGPYAWLGTYILPAYRGRLAAHAFQVMRQRWAAHGLHRLFAAIRERNRPAQCFITHTLGFTRVGRYTDWSYFEGRLDNVVLYTLRRADASLAWMLAAQRAVEFRHGPPSARRGEADLTV